MAYVFIYFIIIIFRCELKRLFDSKVGPVDAKGTTVPGIDIDTMVGIIDEMKENGVMCVSDVRDWLTKYTEIENTVISWKPFLNALTFGAMKEDKKIKPLEWIDLDYDTAKEIAKQKYEKAKELQDTLSLRSTNISEVSKQIFDLMGQAQRLETMCEKIKPSEYNSPINGKSANKNESKRRIYSPLYLNN